MFVEVLRYVLVYVAVGSVWSVRTMRLNEHAWS